MVYTPRVPTQLESIADVRLYLEEELRNIALEMQQVDSAQFRVMNALPPRVIDGMVVFADGANLDLGDGRGLYERSGDAWVKLGVAAASADSTFYLAWDYGVRGDDADYTSELQDAIDDVNTLGGGVLYLPPGIIRISSQINMKTGVHLVGQGVGNEWVRGAGTWGAFKKGTILHWYGTQSSSVQMFRFGDGTETGMANSAGLRDLYINMRAATGPCTSGIAGNTGCPVSNSPTAISTHSCWGLTFEKVAVQHAGIGFKHTTDDRSSIAHTWRDCIVQDSYKGWYLEGVSGFHVADSYGFNCLTSNTSHSGLDIVRFVDNIAFVFSKFEATEGIPVKINSSNQSTHDIGAIYLNDCLLLSTKESAADSQPVLEIRDPASTVTITTYARVGYVGAPPSGSGLSGLHLVTPGSFVHVISVPFFASYEEMSNSTSFNQVPQLTREVTFSQFKIPAFEVNGLVGVYFKKIIWVTRWLKPGGAGDVRIRIKAGDDFAGRDFVTGTVTLGPAQGSGGPPGGGSSGDAHPWLTELSTSSATVIESRFDITAWIIANRNTTSDYHTFFQVETQGNGTNGPGICYTGLELHVTV